MSQRFLRHIFFAQAALLLSLSACMSACRGNTEEELNPSDFAGDINVMSKIVLVTDSDEWHVQIFKEHLFYSDAVAVKLPAPWRLPDREEAKVLKYLTYTTPSGERFVTSDGYTFGMPSPSVTKAGAKTKYSVLGLWRRKTIIDVPF